MIKDKNKIIEKAREWLYTPWQHNQKTKGLGVDCVNFLAALAHECNYDIPPIPKRYARLAESNEIIDYLNGYFIEKDNIYPIGKADILLFKFSGYNTHVGIATSHETMIHASSDHGCVVEHPIDGIWIRMLKKSWRFEKKWDSLYQ